MLPFKPILKFDFGSRFDHRLFRHHLLKKEFSFCWISPTKKIKSERIPCPQLTTEFVRPNEADMFNGRTSLLKDFQTKDWTSSALKIKAESGLLIIISPDSYLEIGSAGISYTIIWFKMIIIPVYDACKENMQFRRQANWALQIFHDCLAELSSSLTQFWSCDCDSCES